MRTATIGLLSFFSLLSGAHAQFDDAMWIAARFGRTLTKLSASGQVLAMVDVSSNGFDLSRIARAPNGDLWIINFITPTMTIADRNGQNLNNINLASLGSPTNIVFDKAGIAWATFNGAGIVGRFAPNGTLLNTIPTPGTPLEITIDNQGFVWVGHRVNAPSRITKIDPITFATQIFYFPTGSRTLGGNIMADSPGIVGKSRIWSGGDSGNELVTFDDQGNVLNTMGLGTVSTAGINGMTLDSKGNVWVVHFRTGTNKGEVYCVDRNNYAILQTISDGPEPISVSTDSYGRVWYMNRVSFSGPQPSEIRRIDRTNMNLFEVTAPCGVGAYNPSDPNGFLRAFVTDPLGDFDNDSMLNITECQNGTSPYDPQSNGDVHILTQGKTAIGNTATLELKSNFVPHPIAVAFAPSAGYSIPIPSIGGKFRLDPTTMYPFTISPMAPGSVPFPIPNSATLIGYILHMQALTVVPTAQFSNDTAFVVQ